MDRELLIEIGVEELPAAWLPGLTKQLQDKLGAHLRELRMAPDVAVESYSTPRRLTGRVARIPERQEDLEEVITGPAVSAAFSSTGEPTPAAIGFARKQGIPIEALERHETPKGTYLAARKRQRGRSAVDALPDLLTGLLRDLSFPKKMHWDALLDDGRGEFAFGRPIRWLLFLYGGRVVPFSIGRMANAAGPLVQEVTSGAVTYGHRFLATSGRAGRSVKVRTFEDYRARLSEHFVLLDHAERRDRIVRELELKARKLGGRVPMREHAALLDEVADLVEYPAVVAGFFDHAFLQLPHEVLTTTLVHHQHFFPVGGERGELKEAFLAVVNTSPADERPIARNAERVVAARLRDAKFFWDADRRHRLSDRLERLDTVVFHRQLGSYRDKANRLETLAGTIASDAFGRSDHARAAALAARLAKADLTTEMVFEFPELQGTMGGIYAREEGLPEEIWKAIYYHYLPIGAESDAPPSAAQLGPAAIPWAAVSLADKLDTIVGLAAVGESVTGSRDPYALRRAAQGIIRILIDLPNLTGLTAEISLDAVISQARRVLGLPSDRADYPLFLYERLVSALIQRGFPVEVVRAVVVPAETAAMVNWNTSPLRARRIAEALQSIRSSADFQALAVLFKRVKNIARELNETAVLDRQALTEPAERALLDELDVRKPRVAQAAAAADYRRALAELAGLRAVVDRFFVEVFVMVDDRRLRTARLELMAELRDLVLDLADISEIVPQAE